MKNDYELFLATDEDREVEGDRLSHAGEAEPCPTPYCVRCATAAAYQLSPAYLAR